VETVQKNGVCHFVQYPCKINEKAQERIELIMKKLISAHLTGIFNFEFFVDKNDNVYINEGAPRTHNSQHLTIDASNFSQFDLLAFYLTDSMTAPRDVQTKPSLMVNLLGKSTGPARELKLPEFSNLKVFPKLYGKIKSTPGRKMGHVNIVDDDNNTNLRAIGEKILKEYDL